MRALVVGAGSVGGYFGSHLAAAGRDVTFLVRARRASQVADGLTIISKGQETRVAAKVIMKGEAAGNWRVSHPSRSQAPTQLEAAIEDCGGEVFRPRSMILPVLNGMKALLDILRSRFGSHCVIGGVAKIASRP